METKLINTGTYLLIADDHKDIEENMFTIKDGKIRQVSYLGQDNGDAITYHLPLNGSPVLEGVPLLPPIEFNYNGLDLFNAFYAGVDYESRAGKDFEQFINYLKQSKMPTGFRFEMERIAIGHNGIHTESGEVPKTITLPNGNIQAVGEYIY